MKTIALICLSSIFASGVCLAQAPVVDVQDNTPRVSPAISTQSAPAPSAISGPMSAYELQERLETLEQIVDSRTASQQRVQMRVEELQNDIDDMRGSIELHNHQLEKLLERQRELFLELDRRFSDMQESSSQLSNNISSNSGSTSSVNASTGDEQGSYQAAVNLILKDKDYDKAIPAFQQFLSTYPRSDLTANAHYWLGQLLYNKQDFAGAKKQFEAVSNNFSDSPKRADSLLKLGLIEKSSGNTNTANNFFKQVVNQYPNSSPARLASQQLGN